MNLLELFNDMNEEDKEKFIELIIKEINKKELNNASIQFYN